MIISKQMVAAVNAELQQHGFEPYNEHGMKLDGVYTTVSRPVTRELREQGKLSLNFRSSFHGTERINIDPDIGEHEIVYKIVSLIVGALPKERETRKAQTSFIHAITTAFPFLVVDEFNTCLATFSVSGHHMLHLAYDSDEERFYVLFTGSDMVDHADDLVVATPDDIAAWVDKQQRKSVQFLGNKTLTTFHTPDSFAYLALKYGLQSVKTKVANIHYSTDCSEVAALLDAEQSVEKRSYYILNFEKTVTL